MSKKDQYEDISSSSKKEKFKTFFLKNRKRNLKALLSILICVVLVVAAMAGAYVRRLLSLINYNEGNEGNPEATFATGEEEENLNFETMYDIASADSIKDLIKSWATNGGEKLHSKNVINVLLIGEDNDDGSHRSDSMILASINTKTKKITLCSFLRDTYTYMVIKDSERYDKTNHAYSWAGPAKVMEVLSNNYKIQIDHYVSIDFGSFEKVIDLLGGVTVPITESEARYMNRTTQVKGFEAGDAVRLNGKRALIYSRIRKLDSEVERTRRQRNVISSVVKGVKASSISEINNLVETFLPYVTTNYRYSEILSLATTALTDKWMNYEIVGMFEPSDDLRVGVSGFRTYTGYLDVWIADYVKAAREVQLALYGTTNIVISPDHKSAIDLVRGGSYDYDYEGTYSSDDNDFGDNDQYDETSTTRSNGIWGWWNSDRTEPNTGEGDTTERTSGGGFTLFPRTTTGDNTLETEPLDEPDYTEPAYTDEPPATIPYEY